MSSATHIIKYNIIWLVCQTESFYLFNLSRPLEESTCKIPALQRASSQDKMYIIFNFKNLFQFCMQTHWYTGCTNKNEALEISGEWLGLYKFCFFLSMGKGPWQVRRWYQNPGLTPGSVTSWKKICLSQET